MDFRIILLKYKYDYCPVFPSYPFHGIVDDPENTETYTGSFYGNNIVQVRVMA